jgi:preprotein translocase subunit SecG
MNAEDKHKRIQELRRIGFQKLLTGFVILFAVVCIGFIFLDASAETHSHSHSSRRGLGILLLVPAYGLWSIVRGVICLVRAQSGDENYAKGVEDAMDKYEAKQEERFGQKVSDGSMRNVLVLLVWIFLFIAAVVAICIGYDFLSRR